MTTAKMILDNIEKGEYDLSNEVKIKFLKNYRVLALNLETLYLCMQQQEQIKKERLPMLAGVHVNYKTKVIRNLQVAVEDAADDCV